MKVIKETQIDIQHSIDRAHDQKYKEKTTKIDHCKII